MKKNEPKNIQKTVNLTPSLVDKINMVAEIEDRSFGYICTAMIKKGLATTDNDHE